jgi:3-deoxy-D-manno-octulosonic-acid transferase
MRRLYNILFTVFFLLASPYYFFRLWRRGNWRAGFQQRFGAFSSKVKQAVTNRHVLWLHAVSVGEVNLCTQLIKALEPRLPNLKLVVSTTTTTGMGELQKKLPSHIQKVYYPIDRWAYVVRALKTLHPEAIVLIEAEIWPNFIWRARDLRIPVFLVNARLSERSFRGYRRLGFLFRPLFATLAGVGCQNEQDAARLRELGVRPEVIRVVGSMKYDAARLEERRLVDVPRVLQQLGLRDGAKVLVAGSTHAGEEAVLAEVFLRLRTRFPELFLVLAPRHFERGRAVGHELETRKIKFVYRSQMSINTHYSPGEVECLLLNTTGELKYFYEYGHVIFIGKSLKAEGGQNPIEPAILGKPIVFGPHMQNFAQIARAFVDNRAAVQVPDEAGLETALADLLANPARAAEMGRVAKRVVRENFGAIERTIDMIVSHWDGLRFTWTPKRAEPADTTETAPTG